MISRTFQAALRGVRFVFCFGAGLLAVASAQAGTITWGPAMGITGDADVTTEGTLVTARNIGGPGAGSTTVNGVTFTPLALSGSTVAQPDVTFDISGTTFSSSNNVGSASSPFASLSTDYQALLSSAAGDFNTPFTLTLHNLTIGAEYIFQSWSNTSTNLSTDVVLTAGGSVTVNSNTSAAIGGVGQYVIGRFTADSVDQVITYSSNIQNPINAFQLREAVVPEPSSIVLVGLGSLAPLACAWRRKAAGRGVAA